MIILNENKDVLIDGVVLLGQNVRIDAVDILKDEFIAWLSETVDRNTMKSTNISVFR